MNAWLKKHYWIAALAVLAMGGWVGTKLFMVKTSDRSPMQAMPEDPTELIEQLTSSDMSVRSKAASKLSHYENNNEVAQALMTFFDNEDNPILRETAIIALSRQEDSKVTEFLFLVASTEVEPRVRLEAAEKLFYRGDLRSVEVLLKLARRVNDVQVKLRALIMLGSKRLGEDVRVRKTLLSALKDSEWSVREEAAEALRYHRSVEVRDALAFLLLDDHEYRLEVQFASATSLAVQGDLRSVDLLIGILQNPDRDIHLRRRAVVYLGFNQIWTDSRVEPALIRASKNPDPELRTNAQESLQRIQKDKAH